MFLLSVVNVDVFTGMESVDLSLRVFSSLRVNDNAPDHQNGTAAGILWISRI